MFLWAKQLCLGEQKKCAQAKPKVKAPGLRRSRPLARKNASGSVMVSEIRRVFQFLKDSDGRLSCALPDPGCTELRAGRRGTGVLGKRGPGSWRQGARGPWVFERRAVAGPTQNCRTRHVSLQHDRRNLPARQAIPNLSAGQCGAKLFFETNVAVVESGQTSFAPAIGNSPRWEKVATRHPRSRHAKCPCGHATGASPTTPVKQLEN